MPELEITEFNLIKNITKASRKKQKKDQWATFFFSIYHFAQSRRHYKLIKSPSSLSVRSTGRICPVWGQNHLQYNRSFRNLHFKPEGTHNSSTSKCFPGKLDALCLPRVMKLSESYWHLYQTKETARSANLQLWGNGRLPTGQNSGTPLTLSS